MLNVDLSPSVSSGVLANIVRMPESSSVHESSIVSTDRRNTPVMLQTTAAVHPGASGGAVVNSDGRLIGLVTRFVFLHHQEFNCVLCYTQAWLKIIFVTQI